MIVRSLFAIRRPFQASSMSDATYINQASLARSPCQATGNQPASLSSFQAAGASLSSFQAAGLKPLDYRQSLKRPDSDLTGRHCMSQDARGHHSPEGILFHNIARIKENQSKLKNVNETLWTIMKVEERQWKYLKTYWNLWMYVQIYNNEWT